MASLTLSVKGDHLKYMIQGVFYDILTVEGNVRKMRYFQI